MNNKPTELLRALQEKDMVTYRHSLRVAELLKNFSLFMGYSEEKAEKLYLAGLFHDVGKMGVSSHILCKPGKLTPDEMEKMKQHTTKAEQFLMDYELPKVVWEIARGHHLSYSGNGYPNAEAKGTNIPEEVRMSTIVDVYEALTAKRQYKDGMSTEEALQIMDNSKNLDPSLYCKFKNFIKKVG